MHTYSKKRVIASQQWRYGSRFVIKPGLVRNKPLRAGVFFVKGAQKKASMNTYA
jgi:hypothetical protein